MSEEFGTSWHSYPSIYPMGHRILSDLLADDVVVQEKVDGSQFSFGCFNGEYRARSKGATLNLIAPDSMFKKGCEVIQSLPLHDGWTYRGEYLMKPKHNALAYDRVPQNHIILFDINIGHEEYLSYTEMVEEAKRIGFECVPLLHAGKIDRVEVFRELLQTTSVLGGQKIEGVVVKNYLRFGPDKKALMGKFVSEEFNEVHNREWKASNPGKMDIVSAIIESLKTPARWNKAVQHLTERGELTGSPRDIGLLIREVPADILKEEQGYIQKKLFEWAWKHIARGVVHGLPEWYKDELLKKQFTEVENAPTP